ncbi:MAG: hypothetical protein ACRDF8_02100 [Chloroflexota bacterium]
MGKLAAFLFPYQHPIPTKQPLEPRCQLCGESLDDSPISPGIAAELRQQPRCIHCGGLHHGACPRLKATTWNSQHEPQSAEYWPDGQWCRHNVIFAEAIVEEQPQA